MAHVTNPDFIALQVRDLVASQTFYTEQLGLTVDPHSPPNAVVFQTEPAFAIRAPMIDLDAVPRLGWGVVVWLACDDADALHAALVAAGVPVIQPPFDGPFGRTFTITDPDGYTLTLHNTTR